MSHRFKEFIASVPEANRWKLDKEIDFENKDTRGRVIPQHLGRIASVMANWEIMAPFLGLTEADVSDITEKYIRKPALQRYSVSDIRLMVEMACTLP